MPYFAHPNATTMVARKMITSFLWMMPLMVAPSCHAIPHNKAYMPSCQELNFSRNGVHPKRSKGPLIGNPFSSRLWKFTHCPGMKNSYGKVHLTSSTLLIPGITKTSFLLGAIVHKDCNFLNENMRFLKFDISDTSINIEFWEFKVWKESLECPPLPFIFFGNTKIEMNSNNSNPISKFLEKFFNHGKKGETRLLRKTFQLQSLRTHFPFCLYTWASNSPNRLMKIYKMVQSS